MRLHRSRVHLIFRQRLHGLQAIHHPSQSQLLIVVEGARYLSQACTVVTIVWNILNAQRDRRGALRPLGNREGRIDRRS